MFKFYIPNNAEKIPIGYDLRSLSAIKVFLRPRLN